MSMPEWPDQPTAGNPVDVPLGAPALLLRAVDYRGDAQFVAIYHDGAAWRVNDGVTIADADPYGVRLFRSHLLVRQMLHGYDLGADERPAVHWLVVDQAAARLSVAVPGDAAALLASQPQTRQALTGDMTAADAAQYLAVAADVAADQTRGPDTWLRLAGELRHAQQAMVAALNLDVGGRLAEQIHNLAVGVEDATRHPNSPRAGAQAPWADIDRKQAGPAPDPAQVPDPAHPPERPDDARQPPEPDEPDLGS